jgi:hypothetical protein
VLELEYVERARRALAGVGDAMLGEWLEVGEVAVHLRRRCSADEWPTGRPWGDDLRHTDAGRARLLAAGLPPGMPAAEW